MEIKKNKIPVKALRANGVKPRGGNAALRGAGRFCGLLLIMFFILSGALGCAHAPERRDAGGTDLEKAGERKYEFKKINYISASELKEDEWAVENYFIEIGDILEISVWQIEELHREVVVRPDGKISFPLIGDVPAQGRTIEELRENIVERIEMYIKAPQVSVNIIEFGGKKAVILGEIRGPGVIRFNAPTRVMEAVGLAGDFTTDANPDKIFIVRDIYEEEPTIILVNANSVMKQANLKENVLVHSGDIIYIPRAFIADFKYFMDNIFGTLIGYAETYYGDTWRRKKAGKWRHVSDDRWP